MEESARDEVDCNQTESTETIIAKVQTFLQEGCGCHRGLTGGQCCNDFSQETVLNNVYNCRELSHTELDLVILAHVQAFMAVEATGEKRKRNPPYSFLYRSRPICKEMFLNLCGISKSRFQRLVDHYNNHGVSVQMHGNSRRLPHNTLPNAVVEDVKNFLSNFADENAVLLPGRIPGFKVEDIWLLSSRDTKMHVWNASTRICKSQPSKLSAIRNLSTCGSNFIQTLSTYASLVSRTLLNYFEWLIFRRKKRASAFKHNKRI